MKLGQQVKARFITIPKTVEGRSRSIDDVCPIRSGTVTYIHPQKRFVCVTTHTGGGDVTETFRLCEVMV